MPDDINGNYSLPNGYLAITGEKVLPSNHNPPLEDIASALTARFSRDGRAPMLGNVPMGGFLITNMGDAVEAGDAINKGQLLGAPHVFTKTQTWSKGADVASAAALTLGDDGNYFDVTGTTAITSIATVGVGTVIKLHFDGSLTLTHHSTDLVLPGGANITTAAGDEVEFVEYDAGKWRCTSAMVASMRTTQSLSGPGYLRFPSGLIVQWGSSVVTTVSEVVLVNFALTFPTAAIAVVVNNGDTNTAAASSAFGVHGRTNSQFALRTAGFSGTVRADWIAIGY